MSEEASSGHPQLQADQEQETSLLDALIVLAKHKRLVLGFPIGVAILAALVSVLLPNMYIATARILPPQQGQSTASILAQLSAQVIVGGGAPSLGIRNPNDLYVGMLKSRTVADNLIVRFDLQKLYDKETLSDTRKKLVSRTTITSGRDGIIAVDFEDKDPKRAAAIANSYVEELQGLTTSLAVTEAAQRRLFFENQVKHARNQLVQAEVALRQAIDAKGLAGVDVQTRAILEPSAQLRAQIALREVQVSAIRIFATESHPDIERLKHEIASMKRELSKLEGGYGDTGKSKVSPEGLDNLRRFREVKFLERLTELLTQQFEAAKIDEAKDMSIVQVLDRAVEPDKRSKPLRLVIVLVSAFLALAAAVGYVLVRDVIERMKADPEQGERLQTFRRYLNWR